jgi:hypothetical protein
MVILINSDFEFLSKLIHNRDILSTLSKELNKIDLVDIFKTEIKSTQFNLEQYMKFPNFYNIFTQLSNSLFNAFSRVERERLLTSFYEMKSRFDLIQNEENDSLVYHTLLQFFFKFISTIDLQFIIDNDKAYKFDSNMFSNKNIEIFDKSNVIMNELYKLFEATGFVEYLLRDINYNCVERRDTLNISDNDYLVVDKNEYKMDSLVYFIEEDELLGRKIERPVDNEVEIESFKLNFKKRTLENKRYSNYDDSPIRYNIQSIK